MFKTFLFPKTVLVEGMTNKQFLFCLQSEEKVSVHVASIVDAVGLQDGLKILHGATVRQN